MIGHHFDNIYFHTKSIEKSRGLGYKNKNGISDKLLFDILKSFSWNAKNLASDSDLWNYMFGLNGAGEKINTKSAKERTNEVWRRIINNLPYLLKNKGTRKGIYAIMACYGIPSSNLSILEFGGPEASKRFDEEADWLNFAHSQAIANIDAEHERRKTLFMADRKSTRLNSSHRT